jgi:cytosine permease
MATEETRLKTISNDYATQRVPMSERKSTLSVSLVVSGFCICMSGLFTGAAMAAGLSLREALIAAFIGNVILSAFGGAVGAAGAREGLSASRLSIYSFGSQGFKIVSLVLALTMGGWFSVQSGFFGITINAMFPNAGFITHPQFAGVWGGLLMLMTAYFGYKGLEVLSKIAIPLIVIISLIGINAAINSAGGWDNVMSITPVGSTTISAGIVLVVGSFAAGASAQADVTRYSKDAKTAWIATIIGFMVANSFIIVAGYLSTLATGMGDLPNAMLHLGLGFPALMVLILAQWTTNDNNLYTSSLGLSNIFRIGRSRIVIIVGVIGSILGGLGVADYFRKQNYKFKDESILPKWNANALLAWLIGCVVGFTVKFGVASLNSLIVTVVAYVIIMKIRPIYLEHMEIEEQQ